MRVLLCDDRAEVCEETKETLTNGAPDSIECTTLHSTDLSEALKRFFDSVYAVLQPQTDDQTVKSDFDGYDLIVIDNALSHLRLPGARQTAESIAGYIRAFSSSPYVVSLNKNDDVDFDLSYLVGDHTTRTDLAINTDHLENKALWTGRTADAKGGFLPWYWPALLEVPARRRKQIAFVEENLENSILESLEFPPDVIDDLSRHAQGILSPFASSEGEGEGTGSVPVEEVTFRQFFLARERSIPAREDRNVVLAKKLDSVVARAVAADLGLWFRRDVIGPQDLLVDLPHLVSRMPFLLGQRATEIAAWDETSEATAEPFGFSRAIYKNHIKQSRYKHGAWCPKPAFWWRQLKDDEALNELFFTDKVTWEDFVFCEDTSRFSLRSNVRGKQLVTEFATEFEGAWNRRYVANFKGVNYAPRSRFAF